MNTDNIFFIFIFITYFYDLSVSNSIHSRSVGSTYYLKTVSTQEPNSEVDLRVMKKQASSWSSTGQTKGAKHDIDEFGVPMTCSLLH